MIHDSDSPARSTCREHDESMWFVMAARQLEALRVGWRIGQYVAEQKARLLVEDWTPEQRAWQEDHIKGHEEWYAESVRVLEAERLRHSPQLPQVGVKKDG